MTITVENPHKILMFWRYKKGVSRMRRSIIAIQQWQDFHSGRRVIEVDVRNSIQTNYTPYLGDESFHWLKRSAQHQTIWSLFEQGWATAAMAQEVGLGIRTVQRDLRNPQFADPQH